METWWSFKVQAAFEAAVYGAAAINCILAPTKGSQMTQVILSFTFSQEPSP